MPEKHPLVFKNARIIDGSGAPSNSGDVAVADDRIVAISAPNTLVGEEVIDCGGKALAPGFIDVHTHDDRLVLIDRDMAPKVSQGVSTVIVGNCGISLSPLNPGKRGIIPPFNLLGGRDD